MEVDAGERGRRGRGRLVAAAASGNLLGVAEQASNPTWPPPPPRPCDHAILACNCIHLQLCLPADAAAGDGKEGGAEQQAAAGGSSGAEDDPEAEDVMERTPEKVRCSQGTQLGLLSSWAVLVAVQVCTAHGPRQVVSSAGVIRWTAIAKSAPDPMHLQLYSCVHPRLSCNAPQGDDDYMGPSAGCTAVCALVRR